MYNETAALMDRNRRQAPVIVQYLCLYHAIYQIKVNGMPHAEVRTCYPWLHTVKENTYCYPQEMDEPLHWQMVLNYLNLDYDIFGLLYDIPASCCLSFLISFISSDR